MSVQEPSPGGRCKVPVVADAGPILHLHWIGCISWGLPPTAVHIVEQVWIEITQHAEEALGDARFRRQAAPDIDPALQGSAPTVHRHSSSQFPPGSIHEVLTQGIAIFKNTPPGF